MNKLKLLGLLSLLAFFSCNKMNDHYTRVGFYFEANHAKADQSYDLYIDDRYEGKIRVLNAEPSDSAMLFFKVLDSKRHYIDIKCNGVLLSANYLEIKPNQVKSGTNLNKSQQVSGVNGFRCRKDDNKSYMIYAAFK